MQHTEIESLIWQNDQITDDQKWGLVKNITDQNKQYLFDCAKHMILNIEYLSATLENNSTYLKKLPFQCHLEEVELLNHIKTMTQFECRECFMTLFESYRVVAKTIIRERQKIGVM